MRCIKNRYPCIYKATSKTTGKSYIGKTIGDVGHRISEHIHVSKEKYLSKQPLTKFQQALICLGEEDFEWEILYQCSQPFESKKMLNEHLIQEEIKYTLSYNSVEDGYNENYGNGKIGYSSLDLTLEERKKLQDRDVYFKRDERRQKQSDELFNIKEERDKIKGQKYIETKYNKTGPKPKHLNNQKKVKINEIQDN